MRSVAPSSTSTPGSLHRDYLLDRGERLRCQQKRPVRSELPVGIEPTYALRGRLDLSVRVHTPPTNLAYQGEPFRRANGPVLASASLQVVNNAGRAISGGECLKAGADSRIKGKVAGGHALRRRHVGCLCSRPGREGPHRGSCQHGVSKSGRRKRAAGECFHTVSKTPGPRGWAGAERWSRLSESNRRPTHYEPVPCVAG
jgi:hypothetical protein